MEKTTAQLNLDLTKVVAWLVAHGVPQDIADKLPVIESKAATIVMMVVTDGKAAAEAFIQSEYAKVVDAVKASGA